MHPNKTVYKMTTCDIPLSPLQQQTQEKLSNTVEV